MDRLLYRVWALEVDAKFYMSVSVACGRRQGWHGRFSIPFIRFPGEADPKLVKINCHKVFLTWTEVEHAIYFFFFTLIKKVQEKKLMALRCKE